MVRLFVGNLQQDRVTEDDIGQLFQEHGLEADNIQVKGNYAFVDVPDQETADRAIDSLNRYSLMGEEIQVEPSVSKRRRSNRVIVSNLPPQITPEDLSSQFGQYGSIKEISKGRDEGSMMVTYMSPEQAQGAVENLQGTSMFGTEIKLEFENNRRKPGNNNMGQRRQQTGPYRREEFPLRIAVPSEMVGAIIGLGGKTIKNITQQSKARVDVLRRENSVSSEKMIVILANQPENCTDACREILKVMYAESLKENKPEVVLKILAHNDLCGRLIGKGGNVLKTIMEETCTKIGVSSVHEVTPAYQDRTIEVRGSNLEDQVEAQAKIYTKLKTAYENDLKNYKMDPHYFYHMNMMGGGMMNPGFGMMRQPPYHAMNPYGMQMNPYMDPRRQFNPNPQMEITVYVPAAHVGALIGKGGQFINSIKENSGAQVIVESKEKAGPDAPERAVVIRGNSSSCWNAMYIVFHKVKQTLSNGHMHSLEEPPLRVDMLVPTKMVGRIIGRGGQNVKNITRTSNTTITLPENSANPPEEVPVCIEGTVHCQLLAQQLIRQLLAQGSIQANMNQQPYGRGNGGGGRGRPHSHGHHAHNHAHVHQNGQQ